MKRVNLGEVLRDRKKAGSIPALKEEVSVKADRLNLPELALEGAIAAFVDKFEPVATKNYNHSRPLDVHRWSDHPEVNQFIDKIYEVHFIDGNAGIQKKHLKVLLLDLYLAWSDDPELCISISRDVNAYKPKSRYNALNISKKSIDVLDVLLNAGLIEQKIGFQDSESGRSFLTRIWPTEQLINEFKEAKFSSNVIEDYPDKECIILRGKNKKDIEYDDNDDTVSMREKLKAYNDLLQRTFIDIPYLEEPWIELNGEKSEGPRKVYIRQNNRHIRRIFNRGSFGFGGRHYGGWWQNCPKEYREQIFVNDKPVSEIDYSGLHIALAYALEGLSLKSVGVGDPYEIETLEGKNSADQQRAICKRLMLVAINAKDDKSTFSAYRSEQPADSKEKKYTNKFLGQFLDRLKEKHLPIKRHIASDIGVKLMNLDSQITERIIEYFVNNDIPILTVHDSYLVPFGMEQELKIQMQSAFLYVMGIDGIGLKEETKNPYVFEPLGEEDCIDHGAWEVALEYRTNPTRTERYKRELDLFLKTQEDT